MGRDVQLSVNVDHVATLREARGVSYPSPLEAAGVAESAGASGITVHLRGDRRHIQESDVEALTSSVRGKLNLEMAATAEMIEIATRLTPDQVTLVPERADEITTEGGLDLRNQSSRIGEAARRLREAGIEVSLFLDPHPEDLDPLDSFDGDLIQGFEINTDTYTKASPPEVDGLLEEMAEVAERGHARGLAVYAGHGLTTSNVGPVAALPRVEELNIGHFLVSRSVIVGMERAVEEMLAAIAEGA